MRCPPVAAQLVERLTRLLVVHLLLDRTITAILTISLCNPRVIGSFDAIEKALAPVSMDQRIELAKATNLISVSCASSIKTVNTVRNKLAHYDPKVGGDLSRVQELSSP